MHGDCKLVIIVVWIFPFCVAALRRYDGTFVFNGNWTINWSGEYQAAGTTFTYRRQDTSGPELITTLGPLTESIDIMVRYNLLTGLTIRIPFTQLHFALFFTGNLPEN